MFSKFEIDKAVQAAGVLLRAHPGSPISSQRLLALLYLADRENLKSVARPIIGNHVIASDEGPLHRELAELLGEEQPEDAAWSSYIQKNGQVVELADDPGILDLSPQEIGTLSAVADRHRALSDMELLALTRELPEWRDNHFAKSPRSIFIADMLDAVGWSADDRAAILEEFDDEERLERLLERKPAAARP